MLKLILGLLSAIFVRSTPASSEDVAVKLDAKAEAKGGRLDWRHSVVDLMKVLDLESSLDERTDLADELGYEGPFDGSTRMNMWLHAKLIERVALGKYK